MVLGLLAIARGFHASAYVHETDGELHLPVRGCGPGDLDVAGAERGGPAPSPSRSQETNGLAPSEPRAPARAGRRAPIDGQNSSQAGPAASAEPAGEPPIIVLDTSEVGGILGRPVRSAANESMGRIIDIIVDQTGIPRAAVIDFGGFLGVGSRKIAVDWSAMRFAPNDERSRASPSS